MDFDLIEELNNDEVMELYENIMEETENIACYQYMSGYGVCDNGRRGSATFKGFTNCYTQRCGTEVFYTAGRTFYNWDTDHSYTDRGLVGTICGYKQYGRVYITACRDD